MLILKREVEGRPFKEDEGQTYFTHDNGGVVFKVHVRDFWVVIERVGGRVEWSKRVRRVLLGENPPDHPINSCYERCVGNSLLLETSLDTYVFVGHKIIEFHNSCKIKDNCPGDDWREFGFVSPIGNSDVPYPYAVDEEGKHILFLENVVLRSLPQEYRDDPYLWYYHRCWLTQDLAFPDSHAGFSDIDRFYLGGTPYSLTFRTDYLNEYHRLTSLLGNMEVQLNGEEMRVPLSCEEYVSLMSSFAEEAGFYRLEWTEIGACTTLHAVSPPYESTIV